MVDLSVDPAVAVRSRGIHRARALSPSTWTTIIVSDLAPGTSVALPNAASLFSSARESDPTTRMFTGPVPSSPPPNASLGTATVFTFETRWSTSR